MITVCIPVYNCQDYIETCIDSVLCQTYNNIQILISDDGSTDRTVSILREKYNGHGQITTWYQASNTGWVRNCNFLLSKVATKYYCIMPADDYIPDHYIESLYKVLADDDSLINCYPFIIGVDEDGKNINVELRQQNFNQETGKERMKRFFHHNFNAISFRGLVRTPCDPRLLYLNEFFSNNIMADSFQMVQHAIAGKLMEVDVPYYKRFHDKNTHGKWKMAAHHYDDFYMDMFMLLRRYNIHMDRFRQLLKNRIENIHDVIIMGGGIMGCCMALYMARLGGRVCIIDKHTDLLLGTSSNHEGKIHLGFVYSNDKSLQTGEKMLIDALHFSNLMNNLLDEDVDWQSLKSKKFLYLVSRDSLVREQDLDDYFTHIQSRYTEWISQNDEYTYLGDRPSVLYKKMHLPSQFNAELFQDYCYETEEYAIQFSELHEKIRKKIRETPNIHVFNEHDILSVKKKSNHYEIQTDRTIFYGQYVMNCLWDGQNKIDNQLLDRARHDVNYRYKFGIISKEIPELHRQEYSITIVNGPFGDFVRMRDTMYFSWYPCSKKGFICSDGPCDEWTSESFPAAHRDELLSSHLTIFQHIFKTSFDFIDPICIGGTIVANGDTDIHEKTSALHRRNDDRFTRRDDYYSLSTQKYTCAPSNAHACFMTLNQN